MLPAAMMALDYVKKMQEARQMRKQAQSGILAADARANRAPTYNVQAAQANRQARQHVVPVTAATSALQGYLAKQNKAPEAQQPDPLAQDYQNNPAVPFAGKQMQPQQPAPPATPSLNLQDPDEIPGLQMSWGR